MPQDFGVDRRNVINTGSAADIAHRPAGAARHIGPKVHIPAQLQRGDFARRIQPQLRGDAHLARLLVGQQALGAVGDPAHRTPQLARRPSRPAHIPAARRTSCRTSRRHRRPTPDVLRCELEVVLRQAVAQRDTATGSTDAAPGGHPRPISAHAPRGSIELAVTRETVNCSRVTCAASRNAASVRSASPRFHRKPMLSGYSSHTAGAPGCMAAIASVTTGSSLIIHQHGFRGFQARRRVFRQPPAPPARRRNAPGRTRAGCDRFLERDCRRDGGS